MSANAKKLRQLETILEKEHSALKNGHVLELVDLDVEKRTLIDQLNTQDHSQAEALERLRAIANRNKSLLEAAHAGVKAALNRFDDLIAAQKPMALYGPKGKRAMLSAPPKPSVEKRT